MALRIVTAFQQLEQLPVVKPLLHRRRRTIFESGQFANTFWGVYDSFAHAQAHAPTTKPMGYQGTTASSSDFYEWRMKQVAPCDYPALFWLQQLLPQNPRVLDYGGHVGVLYYAFQKYLRLDDTVRWQVFDVPSVVEEGRRLAQRRDTAQRLSFVDDASQAAASDLLFASGSLQYVEGTVSSLLTKLSHAPRYLLLNMTPVHAERSFVTLQNIGAAFCPYLIRHRAALIADLDAAGYELVDAWQNPDKGCAIPMHPNESLDHYEGFLFRAKA